MNWRDPQHSLAGGAEIYAWEFACALRDEGARVEFVTARETGAAARETIDGIDVRRRGNALTYYPHALLWLLWRRRRLDVVVDADCGIPTFSPLVLSPRRTAIVLVVHHVHLDQFRTYFPAPVAMLGRFLEGFVMPRAYRRHTTVAVSRSTQLEMVERLGWRRPVHVIHNGNSMAVRTEPFDTEPEHIVVLGRLAPHKRVDDVVRAVDELRRSRPAIHLHVVGKGPDRERLEALVASLGLQDHVTLHGFLGSDDKRTVLATSRVHVCGSDVEGWGQVVIEAAALGVPTVARDVPGMRDSIHDGVTGWLLSEQITEDLASCLARGIDQALDELADDARRERLALACERWAESFSWSLMHSSAVGLVRAQLVRQRR